MDLDLLTAMEVEHRTRLLAEAGIRRERLIASLPPHTSRTDALARALRGLADRIDGRRSVTVNTRLA
jgi:hypothetical protein